MWGVLIRLGARYAFFRRWKNTFVIGGLIFLCAITAILIDARMYLSAGLLGVLAVAALFALAMYYLRERRESRERERRKLEESARRAAAAEARSEKFEKVKASASEMAKNMGSSAADLAGVAKSGFSDARDRLSSWRSKREPD